MQSGPLRVGRFAIVLLALYVVGLSSFSVSAESAGDSPKTGDELVTVEVAKSRSKRALWNFGSMIACVIPDVSNAITAAFRYNNYGCWCGTGGSGNPVDEIDHCCRTHDRCYDRLVEERCRPKTDHYTWSCRRGNPTCRSRSWWGKSFHF